MDPKDVAAITDGFSGAEIEQAVIDAMRLGFSEDRLTTMADIKKVVEASTPLSKTMADDIDKVRRWAKGRARMAGKPRKDTPAAASGSSPFMRPGIQGA